MGNPVIVVLILKKIVHYEAIEKFLLLLFVRNRRKRRKEVTLSKTRELGSAVESEPLSEYTEEEVNKILTGWT